MKRRIVEMENGKCLVQYKNFLFWHTEREGDPFDNWDKVFDSYEEALKYIKNKETTIVNLGYFPRESLKLIRDFI